MLVVVCCFYYYDPFSANSTAPLFGPLSLFLWKNVNSLLCAWGMGTNLNHVYSVYSV